MAGQSNFFPFFSRGVVYRVDLVRLGVSFDDCAFGGVPLHWHTQIVRSLKSVQRLPHRTPENHTAGKDRRRISRFQLPQSDLQREIIEH